MIFGYCRVSTTEQNLEGQRLLISERYPTAKILCDEGVSGTVPPLSRPKFAAIVDLASAGDIIVVTAIDRVGRAAMNTMEVITLLQEKGVTLISLREGFDISTPIGKAMCTIIAAFAEMERDNMLERQTAGIRAAREAGKHLGRPIKITPEVRAQVLEKRDLGIPPTRIAADLKIGRASVFRVLREERDRVGQ
ncbi:recombinase family protein [Salmonella enterica]|nr:recombinase family protein [Salmonella enterica]